MKWLPPCCRDTKYLFALLSELEELLCLEKGEYSIGSVVCVASSRELRVL